MGKFTPVADPEKARCEQDEESLRKHRKFDTPFAMLPSNLNAKKKTGKEDMNPMGRQTGELELDEMGLWRKKEAIFDKPQTWGRETVEYSNPEEARADGNKGPKWGRPGVVGWGIQGKFGGRGTDTGLSVLQRGEVNQIMERNEKGLWVRKKVEDEQDTEASEGHWCCPKCGRETIVAMEFCKADGCNGRRPAVGQDADAKQVRSSNPNEDPRLEAAKKKGRGTADAAKEALKALSDRRRKETNVKEQMGMMRRRPLGDDREAPRGGPVKTLNSSDHQVRPAKRLGNTNRWQGIQKTDEDAKKVVGKAVGGSVEANGAPLRVEDSDRSALRRGRGRGEEDDLPARAAASKSRSRSSSGSGKFDWESGDGDGDGETGEVVVDFF